MNKFFKNICIVATLVASSILMSFYSPVSAHPNWDKSSLHFNGGCNVSGCESAIATVCTDTYGTAGTTTYEIYYAATGNPRNGAVVATGVVPIIGPQSCVTVTYTTAKAGQYAFKVFQREGHPGQGFIWSGNCSVNICSQPTSTPTPTPTVSPSATPAPTVTPTPTPSATPEVSSTPAPSETPGVGGPSTSNDNSSNNNNTSHNEDARKTSLSTDNLQDTNTSFDAVMDVKENGNPIEGKAVVFVYNGTTKIGTTDKNGRATVIFDQNGNGVLSASAEGYPSQSLFLTMPTKSKLIAAIPRGVGQVLGATTLAKTGNQFLYFTLATFTTGFAVTLSAAYGFIQNKKK